MRVFSVAKKTAQRQKSMRLQFGSAEKEAVSNFKRDKSKITNFSVASHSGSPIKTQWPFKDGEQKNLAI